MCASTATTAAEPGGAESPPELQRPKSSVVVAAIRDAEGRFLLSLRHSHLLGGGYWEFPGGKVEPGESEEEALAREISEEVSLEIGAPRFLCRYQPPAHAVGKPSLSLYEVSGWRGRLRHQQRQQLQWLPVAELASMKLLPASIALLDSLRLAPLMCISPPWPVEAWGKRRLADILGRLEGLRERSGERVQLLWRQPHWPAHAQREALLQLAEPCRRAGIGLIVGRSADLALACGIGAVHLGAAQLLREGRAPDDGLLRGGAIHNEAEAEAAKRLGARYGLISPVRPTPSKPGAAAIGWPGFARLLGAFDGLGYALGGVDPQDLAQVRALGGFGVAGIRFWTED